MANYEMGSFQILSPELTLPDGNRALSTEFIESATVILLFVRGRSDCVSSIDNEEWATTKLGFSSWMREQRLG